MSVARQGEWATPAWHLESYDATLRAADRSLATQRAYFSDTRAFISWASDHNLTSPTEVTKRTLRDYLVFITERGD